MNAVEPTNRKPELIPSIVIFTIVVGIALLGGLATDTASSWYRNLALPAWQPPSWLFAPAWGTIYLLFATSAIIVRHRSTGAVRAGLMRLYLLNGILNLAWSYIFFQGHSPFWGGVEILAIWLTIVLLMRNGWPVSRLGALLLLPYLLWVSFATVLTWSIFAMNRGG